MITQAIAKFAAELRLAGATERFDVCLGDEDFDRALAEFPELPFGTGQDQFRVLTCNGPTYVMRGARA